MFNICVKVEQLGLDNEVNWKKTLDGWVGGPKAVSEIAFSNQKMSIIIKMRANF